MLRIFTVERQTLALLKQLQQMPLLQTSRLVGGTALALQLGHRNSVDLDLFGEFQNSHIDFLDAFGDEGLTVNSLQNTKSIHVFEIEGVKVDIVNYPYEWLEEPLEDDGIKLSRLRDIAAMKLAAITNRGTKKDFIDMYFLLQHFSLNEMLGFYMTKYNTNSIYNVIRSLVYFTDAENDPMPKMYIPVSWDEVKSLIKESVEKISV
ncbi:nucleotidyl transferase AbiEii/AbiGii toxin family protein [Proteiniphilum sp.]|uniref:nucleotidyl transferase AbiEii/AbiGii toxin family protein n=1 Tax=Proteiniphilum sp. TaxID=1926877 RepID=UPI002B21CDED|nr:nucleotidyl transferase AbiEii/AbiGii toxin family protein [Proteiniphilum sp.]MEA4916918.1 nucleotidyl transferase AbiEii/AbiGii toxin family protein [Proteiniphilum sp.]